MTRERALRIGLVLGLVMLLVAPALASAAAGGSTGGGGGGGGGGGSGGGGGVGGGGGSGTGSETLDGIFVAITVVGVIVLSFSSWFTAQLKVIPRRRRAKRMRREAEIAALADPSWDPAALRARVVETFFPIQRTWAANDPEASDPFVSDALLERHRLQLEGYVEQGRVNRIEDLKLEEVEIIRVHNVSEDHLDHFVAYVEFRSRDWMEDAETGKVVNGVKKELSTFRQFWSYTRDPEEGWVLDEIQQESEGKYHLKADPVNVDRLVPA